MASAIPTTRKRSKLRLTPSQRVVFFSVLVVSVVYFGWSYLSSVWIMNQHFPAIMPGKVSLIGIKSNGGFKIIVANRIAQLVEKKDGPLSNDDGGASDSSGETEGAVKKRIPVKELLGALTGDTDSLSKFFSKLNGLEPDESWPTTRIIWKAEDIRTALDHDGDLRKRLIKDLNVELDGTPLPELRVSAIENGIIVDTPVKLNVQVGEEKRVMTARVQRPFLPHLMKVVFDEYKEKANITNEVRAGSYLMHAKDKKQDIRAALESLISPKSLADEVQHAEDVLSTAVVVVNEKFIDKASYVPAPIGAQTMYNMVLHVTDDGRNRLWQYSKLHPGDQLLLVSDGVAIAAPRIRHDLWTSDFDISQMPDEVLVQDAVNSINAAHGK